MRTLMVTDGTLGSVRIMVALGCGLVKRGHKPVLVACPARFRALVEDYGLRWTAFDPSPLSSLPFRAFAEALEEVCRREGIDQTRDSTATQQRTCIVSEQSSLHAAYSLAEKFAVCWVGVFWAPVAPTDAYPSLGLTAGPEASTTSARPCSAPARLRVTLPVLGRVVPLPHHPWFNRWSHLLGLAADWLLRGAGREVNAWRQERLRLPPIPNVFGVVPLIRRQTLPIIHTLHPGFFAKPHDWPAELKVPAFLFLPDRAGPAPFLSSDLRLELAAESAAQASAPAETSTSTSWAKQEDDESVRDEEARLERFLTSGGEASTTTRRAPVLLACGGLVEDAASARTFLDVARRLTEAGGHRVIIFIRDEDGPAKRLPSLSPATTTTTTTQTTEGAEVQAATGDDGDGVIDVHPAWADLIYAPGALPDSLCVVSRLSYASLLPRCGCVVLDAGHAITAAAIRANAPLVCVPRGDRVSWFWANQAHERGIAPRPIARENLSADALLQAIDQATSADTSRKLQELSQKVNADGDGVRKVVDAFERVCITSIGLVPTSDYADVSSFGALAHELGLRDTVLAAGFVLLLLVLAWLLLRLLL